MWQEEADSICWDAANILSSLVRPHPPVTRALRHAVSKLKEAGIKVVDFEPYKHQEGSDIILSLYFPDAARTQKDLLAQGGEPIAALTEWAFSSSRPDPLSIPENWALNVRRDAYREEYVHLNQLLPRLANWNLQVSSRHEGKRCRRHPLSCIRWGRCDVGFWTILAVYSHLEHPRPALRDFPYWPQS